jgi:L-iditol 2-dehydrogenase
MKAARLYGPRDLRVESVPDPRPGPGEALIRIRACGVCPSDLRSYLGSRPSPTPPGVARSAGSTPVGAPGGLDPGGGPGRRPPYARARVGGGDRGPRRTPRG